MDGSIEKDIYLTKKDELIKNKLSLLEKQQGFWQAGNTWNEPFREWIISAANAEKLAQEGQLDEIKSFVKKIGTPPHLQAPLHWLVVTYQYISS